MDGVWIGSGVLLVRLSGITIYGGLHSRCCGSLHYDYYAPYGGQWGMSLFDVLGVSVWGSFRFADVTGFTVVSCHHTSPELLVLVFWGGVGLVMGGDSRLPY